MTNSSWLVFADGVFATENERTSSDPGIVMSKYWPAKCGMAVGFDELQDQVTHVVRDRFVGHDLGLAAQDRVPRADHLLVVVEELDRDVLVDVRPAQQGEAFVLLEVGQGEGRVLVQLDVLAVEDEGLARRALALLAAVHEHDSLLGRGAEDVLRLVDLDLDADRLETYDVLAVHGSLPRCVVIGRGLD